MRRTIGGLLLYGSHLELNASPNLNIKYKKHFGWGLSEETKLFH